MTKQDDGYDWKSSSRGEQAWKEAREHIASRNAQARKAGRLEREAYERGREDVRRSTEAKRHARLVAAPRHGRRDAQR
jgi:hypothetical protein